MIAAAMIMVDVASDTTIEQRNIVYAVEIAWHLSQPTCIQIQQCPTIK